ncbi:MAG: hypothetical protein U0931_21150 [Vulcanimicrobiota bacterium]
MDIRYAPQLSSPLPFMAPARPSIHLPEDVVTLDGDSIRQRDRELQVGLDIYQANPAWQSLPGGLRVQNGHPEATLAIIDLFGMQGPGNTPAHGEGVAALAQRASGQGEENILRLDVGAVPSEWAVNFATINRENFSSDLDRLISRFYIGGATVATQGLREIREHHPNIRTVNQSMGVNGPSILANLAESSERFEPLRQDLCRELGLPAGTHFNLNNPEALAALARRVQSGLQKSPEVAEARRNLQEELERGRGQYTYFNSAGNHGIYQTVLAQAGFQFDREFQGNAPSNSPATQTVGAVGPFGVQPYSQNVPYAAVNNDQVRFELDGLQLCGQINPLLIPQREACLPHSGTSYAAPTVAGLHNREQALRRLRQQALPVSEAAP